MSDASAVFMSGSCKKYERFPTPEEEGRNHKLSDLNNIKMRDQKSIKMKTSNNFLKLYDKRHDSDLKLILKDESLMVHKFVLASASTKISKLLYENKVPQIPMFISSLGSMPRSLGASNKKSINATSPPKMTSTKHLSHSVSSPSMKYSDVEFDSMSASLESIDTSKKGRIMSLGDATTSIGLSKCFKQQGNISSDDPNASIDRDIEISNIFEKYSSKSIEILIKLCYNKTVDWREIEVKNVLEAYIVANEFDMNDIIGNIKAYLNSIVITEHNAHEFSKFLYKFNNFKNLRQNLDNLSKNDVSDGPMITDFEVIKGENPIAIKTKKLGTIDCRKDCTYHKIETGNVIDLMFNTVFLMNFIKLRLFDQTKRSYSYYIEVSEDNEKWTLIADYRKYLCRSWQLLYFNEKSVKYIRIVGTDCYDIIECNYFEVSSIEIYNTLNPMKTIDGILCPNKDMAKSRFGAKLLRGVNSWILDNESDETDVNFTYHKPYNDILIQLSQLIYTDSIRLVTWGEIDYEFYISVSTDNKNWNVIYKYEDNKASEHKIRLPKLQPVLFIRIYGENVDENEDIDNTFRIVKFESPANYWTHKFA